MAWGRGGAVAAALVVAGCGSGASTVVQAGADREALASSSRYIVTDLGALPGDADADALALNAWGQVVGVSQGPSPDDGGLAPSHAFLFDPATGAMQAIAGMSLATGINVHGDIAGAVDTACGNRHPAVRWSDGGLQDLGTLAPEPPCGKRVTLSEARGIADDGTVVGEAFADPANHAFRFHAGSLEDLQTPGSPSVANAINARGEIVGGFDAMPGPGQPPFHAFVWRGGAVTDLGTLDASTVATAANDAEMAVGTSSFPRGPGRAVIIDASGVRELAPDAGLFDSGASGINDRGQVVGHASRKSGPAPYNFGFLWQAGQLQDLNTLADLPAGMTIESAAAVNAIGQIAATGRVEGHRHALLLTPRDAGQRPVARIAGGPFTGRSPLAVYLDATTSRTQDPTGWIRAYHWDFDDGTGSDAGFLTHTFASSGEHLVRLTVTDGTGVTATAVQRVVVDGAAIVPKVIARSGLTGTAPFAVELDATPSTTTAPGEDWITGYHWELSDGASGERGWIDHVFTQPGTYTATVTLRDAEGHLASQTVAVQVKVATASTH